VGGSVRKITKGYPLDSMRIAERLSQIVVV
jgi:hypothetical protein